MKYLISIIIILAILSLALVASWGLVERWAMEGTALDVVEI